MAIIERFREMRGGARAALMSTHCNVVVLSLLAPPRCLRRPSYLG